MFPLSLLLCLALLPFLCLSKQILFVKDAKEPECVFNYLDSSFDSTDKSKFTLGTTYMRKKTKSYKLCCPFKEATHQFNTTSRSPCCIIPINLKKYTHAMARPCVGFTYLTRFELNRTVDNFVEYFDPNAPYNRYKCPTQKKLESQSFQIYKQTKAYRSGVFAFTDKKDPCKDPNRKFQVKCYWRTARSAEFIEYLYSWCCSKDIFENYLLDPNKECCGLSGAASPFFSRLNGKVGTVMRDNPPCCRSQASQPLCEPLVLFSDGHYNSRSCPPLSGLANVTTNLAENIPNFAPAYYGFAEGSFFNTDLFTHARCYSYTHPVFYTFRNALDAYKRGFAEMYGLCCTRMNIFAEDAHTMAKECCIAYTSHLKSNKSDPMPCGPNGGGIRSGSIFYKPCVPWACKEKGSTALAMDDKFKIYYDVIRLAINNPYICKNKPATHSTLNKQFVAFAHDEYSHCYGSRTYPMYGSNRFFWDKNTFFVPKYGVRLELLVKKRGDFEVTTTERREVPLDHISVINPYPDSTNHNG